MTTLVVNELRSNLSQNITFKSSGRCHIGSILPYLYLHNSPVGTFKFQLMRYADVVYEREFTSADIKLSLNTTDNYAHVFYPVIPLQKIKIESGDYILKLSSTGYTYSKTSFIGWCQQFENVQNEMDYIPTDIYDNSLAFRFKIIKEGIIND